MRVRLWASGVAAVAVAGLATACSDDGTAGTPVGAGSTPSTSQAPFDGKTLQPGEVVKVDSADGAQMKPIADGMIRSLQTTAKITEVGSGQQINDSGGDSYRAAAGGTLFAFTVTVAMDQDAEDVSDKVVADVNVDGTQRALPDFFGDDSGSSDGGTQLHYVVATSPTPRAVDLELKAANVLQSFDLLQGKPKGDRPAALYRSSSGTTLHQDAQPPVTYQVTVSSGHDYATGITTDSTVFGYFGGKDGVVPTNPANGWLTLNVTENGVPRGSAMCVTPLAAYSLKDAAGHEYKPTGEASSVPAEPELIGDTKAVIAFEVPADFAQGTLTITAPKTIVCQTSTAEFNPRPAHGKATVSISLPAN